MARIIPTKLDPYDYTYTDDIIEIKFDKKSIGILDLRSDISDTMNQVYLEGDVYRVSDMKTAHRGQYDLLVLYVEEM